MKRVLSNEECIKLIQRAEKQTWERVDRFGKYSQTFIEDLELETKLENFLNRKFESRPIVKVLKFEQGDKIPTFTADYTNTDDPYYSKYINTNFITQIYLNTDFTGGELKQGSTEYQPQEGFGLIQKRTDKCSIGEIKEGESYMLFAFIYDLKKSSLL